MNRDYPLAPTPVAESATLKIKEGPSRKVYKRTSITESGDKKTVKQVDSKRGYKVVEKVNGKRTAIGKSY